MRLIVQIVAAKLQPAGKIPLPNIPCLPLFLNLLFHKTELSMYINWTDLTADALFKNLCYSLKIFSAFRTWQVPREMRKMSKQTTWMYIHDYAIVKLPHESAPSSSVYLPVLACLKILWHVMTVKIYSLFLWAIAYVIHRKPKSKTTSWICQWWHCSVSPCLSLLVDHVTHSTIHVYV